MLRELRTSNLLTSVSSECILGGALPSVAAGGNQDGQGFVKNKRQRLLDDWESNPSRIRFLKSVYEYRSRVNNLE